MMAAVSRKFNEDYGIAAVEVPDFGTERFLVELDRLEEQCKRRLQEPHRACSCFAARRWARSSSTPSR